MSGRLGQLSGAFAGHFQATANIFTAIMQTETQVENLERGTTAADAMVEARQRGQEAQQRGATDAMTGREVDSALAANRHYMSARSEASGQLAGRALLDRWNAEVLRTAPTGADITALTSEWMRSRIQPTGDAAYDFHAARVLSRGVDMATTRWRQEGVRQTQQEGVVTFNNAVARSVQSGEFTPGDVQRWIGQYAALNPMDRENGPARVAQLLADNVTPTPEGAARLNTVLSHPESGGNGQSFLDRHAAMRGDFDRRLNARVQSTQTASASQAWNQVDLRIREAGSVEDLVNLEREVRVTLNAHGGEGQAQQARLALAQRRTALVRSTAGINAVDGMLSGNALVDPSVVRENLGAYFASRNVDPRQAPEAAGQVVGRLGAVDDATRQTMGLALGSFGNRAGQVAAYRFWSTVAAGRIGQVGALDLMPENVRPLFQALASLDSAGNGAIEGALETVQRAGGLDLARMRREVPLHQVVGASDEADGRVRVNREVTEQIGRVLGTAGWFSNGVRVDPALADTLREAVHTQALVNQRLGVAGGWEKAAEQALSSASQRIDVIPTLSGQPMAVLRAPGGNHADGLPIAPASPVAFNPATGRPEDTLSRFREDRTDALAAVPAAFRGGTFGLAPASRDMPPGLYPVVGGDGVATMFHAGQTLRVGGQDVTLPADPSAAGGALAAALGGNSRFVVVNRGAGLFALAYRFGFATADVAGREQRHQRRAPFRPSPAPAQAVDSLRDPASEP